MYVFRGFSGVVVVVLLYATFSIGATGGASAAVNESVDYGEYKANVTESLDTVRENVTENLSEQGPGGKFALSMVSPVIEGSFMTAKVGSDVGHSFPLVARANAVIAPFLMLGAVLYPVYSLGRKVLRG